MEYQKTQRPERIIQFGEGGFLRAFADWMLQVLNEQTDFNGSAVIVQPIREGMCDVLSRQDCMYTLVMRGAEGTQTTRIDAISRCVKPYDDYDAYLALAENPAFRFVISNTTEAGIAYEPADRLTDTPPKSFPAKVTALLKRRFDLGLGGFIFLPCELIDTNGTALRQIILQYAQDWKLGDDFVKWVETENIFCNTLVDRIVTGYPRDEDLQLGYRDDMADTCEYFHLWVIEGPGSILQELPFDRTDLNVIITENLEPYRTRKVRILNGAHTSLVPYAMLKGFDTVKSCMDDADMAAFLRSCIFDEIIPTLDLPKQELSQYAEDVLTRFRNPYIKHYLSSIALNSVSKFKVRVLPSILTYRERFGKLPEHLSFAFACLIRFYQTDMANDLPEVIQAMRTAPLAEILKNQALWGLDLSFMSDELAKHGLR